MFDYPEAAHSRRHGPVGYTDYRSFKPWLCDEFEFRCVYCLWRETWCADGDASFSVEHLQPQSLHPESYCDYSNLLYSCCRCNSFKRDVSILDPCHDEWGLHLRVNPTDGKVEALTETGEELIEICRLNRPILVESRRLILAVIELLSDRTDSKAKEVRQRYLDFPDNLPDLSKLRPPGGNTRPEGIEESFYQRRARGELPKLS